MERARVQILPPETAKRIAAGEVIERPASALRELLDNSLDAGADSITVDLQDGGMGLLCVSDNGSGMDKEDLALSVLPHATSKIRQADDLLTLSTLGFRGEALASMAAVARVEIVSASSDDEAWRLYTSPNEEARLERCSG
ncbi:MAG TPA: DNA mismatch repair endonuclease MutL, partial [Spirochaetales bacterium]|nr:DNA mismatch repair endonuclease MutL [Spirochaetales bacterium]